MHPLVITAHQPDHKPGKAPDHMAIGAQLDSAIKEHFMDKNVVIRCIGSQDHPGLTLAKLTDLVVATGTDKYDPTRAGVGYKAFTEKGVHVDFYGEPVRITKSTAVMAQQIWEMHHSALGDRGFGVHVDLVLIYDAAQVAMVKHLYDSHPTSDGFVFKNPANKQAALLGVITIR